MLRISDHFHASDVGRQRQGNEDSYFVRAPLFVVADGMGGAQAGEVASEMAVDSFDRGLPDGSPAEALRWIGEGAIFDLAVLDMDMPEIDGLTLAAELHRLRPALPLVLFSSLGRRGVGDTEGLFNAYLGKPLHQSHLFDTLVALLGEPAHEVALQLEGGVVAADVDTHRDAPGV